MVINNLHAAWAGRFFGPFEAASPLVIDADAVLAFSVPFQPFKTAGNTARPLSTTEASSRSSFKRAACLIPENAFNLATKVMIPSEFAPIHLAGVGQFQAFVSMPPWKKAREGARSGGSGATANHNFP
jgi:hypothetical protein